MIASKKTFYFFCTFFIFACHTNKKSEYPTEEKALLNTNLGLTKNAASQTLADLLKLGPSDQTPNGDNTISGVVYCQNPSARPECFLSKAHIVLGFIRTFSKKQPSPPLLNVELSEQIRNLPKPANDTIIFTINCRFSLNKEEKPYDESCVMSAPERLGEFHLAPAFASHLAARLAQNRPFRYPNETLSTLLECSAIENSVASCGLYFTDVEGKNSHYVALDKTEQLTLARASINTKAIWEMIRGKDYRFTEGGSTLSRVNCEVDTKAYEAHTEDAISCLGIVN